MFIAFVVDSFFAIDFVFFTDANIAEVWNVSKSGVAIFIVFVSHFDEWTLVVGNDNFLGFGVKFDVRIILRLDRLDNLGEIDSFFAFEAVCATVIGAVGEVLVCAFYRLLADVARAARSAWRTVFLWFHRVYGVQQMALIAMLAGLKDAHAVVAFQAASVVAVRLGISTRVVLISCVNLVGTVRTPLLRRVVIGNVEK